MKEFELYSPPKSIIRTRGKIFLNERVSLDLNRPEKSSNFVFFGGTGEGKTIAECVVLSQFDNAIFFDPKAGHPAWNSLKEIGEDVCWNKFEISNSLIKKKKSLKINTCDIFAGVINIVCIKKDSAFETKLRRLLWSFFSKQADDAEKNFNSLEKLLVKNRFDTIADEFRVVLDEADNGMPMEEICNGKKVVNISDFDSNNRGISLLIGNIFFYNGNKNKNKDVTRLNWNDRLAIACDECHTHVKTNTAIGNVMSYIFSQGRSFGITGSVSGTNEEPLPTQIKSNIRIMLLFNTPQEREKFYKKYGVDLDEDSFNMMREMHPEGGNCFLKAEDYGFVEPIPIHVNYFYQKLKMQKEKDETEMVGFSNYL